MNIVKELWLRWFTRYNPVEEIEESVLEPENYVKPLTDKEARLLNCVNTLIDNPDTQSVVVFSMDKNLSVNYHVCDFSTDTSVGKLIGFLCSKAEMDSFLQHVMTSLQYEGTHKVNEFCRNFSKNYNNDYAINSDEAFSIMKERSLIR